MQSYWPGAPDLAALVVSPTTFTEVADKVAEWLAAGSGMVVVVNPRRRVLVYPTPTDVKVLGVDNTLNGGEVVPGWQLPIRELFEI